METELTTNQKGAMAELAIANQAVRHGIEVYRPVAEGGRCDLVFCLPDLRLLRVQCKWAHKRGEVISVNTYTSRRRGGGYARRPYRRDEIETSSWLGARSSTAVTFCRRASPATGTRCSFG